MEFDLPIFDTSPAAIEVKRRLKINWLLKTGQAKQGPEDFLRGLFRTLTLDKLGKDPAPIPSEIKFRFSKYFAGDEHSYLVRQIIGIMKWPPEFPISEKEKADILADAHGFLQGLSVFIKEIRKGILQAGKQGFLIPSVQVPGRMDLTLGKDGILHLAFRDIEIVPLGITTLIRLLDGYPWSALKVCPQCEKVFFTLSQRQKFCSVECNSRSKYEKRTKKTGYPEERRMIARKYYLKKNKYMTDTEIAERWQSEGIEKKWIKRLLPEAS